MVLAPDELQGALYRDELHDNLKQDSALAFAHGFAIHFRQVEPRPDLDIFMVAPKGPGHTVRSEYERGGGVWRLYLAAVDGVPAAFASLYVQDRIGSLAMAAAAPSSRGRGAHTALLNRRIADASADTEHASQQPSEQSDDNERNAFHD